MPRPFAHEDLVVYQKAVAFVGACGRLAATWPSHHAVKDHLLRASESIPLNLVDAVVNQGSDSRLLRMDYALGSALKCAACADVACLKTLLTTMESTAMKGQLHEIARMLVGLRRAWQDRQHLLREEAHPYLCDSPSTPPLFHHEGLDVYRVALEFVAWWEGLRERPEPSERLARKLDASATSMVLNIAEGNGRFSRDDHHRFVGVAASATSRTAFYLDIVVEQRLLPPETIAAGKSLLLRVSAMLARLGTAMVSGEWREGAN